MPFGIFKSRVNAKIRRNRKLLRKFFILFLTFIALGILILLNKSRPAPESESFNPIKKALTDEKVFTVTFTSGKESADEREKFFGLCDKFEISPLVFTLPGDNLKAVRAHTKPFYFAGLNGDEIIKAKKYSKRKFNAVAFEFFSDFREYPKYISLPSDPEETENLSELFSLGILPVSFSKQIGPKALVEIEKGDIVNIANLCDETLENFIILIAQAYRSGLKPIPFGEFVKLQK